MRVLCLNPYLPPPMGGIEKEMLALSGELARMGHDVSLLTTTARFPSGRNRDPPPLPPGVTAQRLDGFGRTTLRDFAPARAPVVVPGLARAAVAVLADLVLVFGAGWPPALRPVLTALTRMDPRPVLLFRTYFHPPGGVLSALKTRYLLRTIARADRAFVPTERERHELARSGHLDPARIAVVPPGVSPYPEDLEAVARVRKELRLDGKVAIAHVARLSSFKGTDALLHALLEVRHASGQDVVLVLAGAAPHEPSLRELLLRRDLAPHVRVVGEVTDDRRLRTILAASDLFALPSRYEAFGIAYIEAEAAGLASVGCDVGGVAEAIGDGGLLVPLGDKKALVMALTSLASDGPRRKELGALGRARVLGSLTWTHAAARLLELAHEVRAARVGSRT